MSTYEVTLEDGGTYEIDVEDDVSTSPASLKDEIVSVADRGVRGAADFMSFMQNINPLNPSGPRLWGLNPLNQSEDVGEALKKKVYEDIGPIGDAKTAPAKILGELAYYVPNILTGGQSAVVPTLAGGATAGLVKSMGGSDIAQTIGGLFGATAPQLFGAAKKVPGILSRLFNPSTEAQTVPAIQETRKVLDSLKNVIPEAQLEAAVTQDARNISGAKAITEQAALEKQAASELFRQLPDAEVNILPTIRTLTRDVATKEGVKNPEGVLRTILTNLESEVPPKQKIVFEPQRIVDESGFPLSQRNPKTGQMEGMFSARSSKTVQPPANVPLERAQNMLRDLSQGANQTKGTWEQTSLLKAKDSLLRNIERQLPKEDVSALSGARKAWAEWAEKFKTGSTEAVQDVITNPDKRIDTFYNTLIRDEKSSAQLLAAMPESEISNVKNLVLQKLLSSKANTWSKFINDKRGALNNIFGDVAVENLQKWASGKGGTVGKYLIEKPSLWTNLSISSPLKAGAVGIATSNPALAVLTYGASVLRGASKSTRQRLVAENLMQLASGNKEIASLLSAAPTKVNLDAAIQKVMPAISAAIERSTSEESEQVSDNTSTNEDFNDFQNQYGLTGSDTLNETKKGVSSTVKDEDFERLVDAVIQVESAGNPKALSNKGARGLMQIMPETAKEIAAELGVTDYDLTDPATSRLFGSHYLKKQLGSFGDDPRLALAAYNAGPGAVEKYGRTIPPYDETQDYVRKVLGIFNAG